jgi:glycosyltransferase involved in cell wall biosynthesis
VWQASIPKLKVFMLETAPRSSFSKTALGAAQAPRVSVIVPAYNAGLQLTRCLEALCRSEYTDLEVLVVDDGSTDNTHLIVERFGVRHLHNSAPMGPGGARNLGVQQSAGEIIVFVDADVVAPPDAIGLMVESLDRDPELAALFGSYDTAPAWPNFLSQYKNLMHHFVHQSSNEHALTFWAGFGAVRKTVFEEIGGFNAEKYPHPSIEDIDLGLRLTRAGRTIRLEKHLQVEHLKRWTLRGLLRADILYRAVPWTKLILETRDLPLDLNLTWPARLSAALVGILVVLLLLMPISVDGLHGKIFTPMLACTATGAAAALLWLNREVYAFFVRRRGWGFALRAVLAHWFYYFYSGTVFMLLCALHFLRLPFRSFRGKTNYSGIRE